MQHVVSLGTHTFTTAAWRLAMTSFSRRCWLCGGLLTMLSAAKLSAQEITFAPVGRSVIEARLQQFANDNKERQAMLQRIFTEAGCRDERLTEQPVKGAKVPNVICTLPGTTDARIIVGAHFDKVRSGRGAADNWSGASLLPSLFQSLNGQVRRHTIVFVGFTDEELGLVGSRYFVRSIEPDQAANIKAMINLDTLGLSPTKVEVSRSDKSLVDLFSRVAEAIKSPVAGLDFDRVGSSDHVPFRERKIPALMVHSLTQETWPILHTEKDNLNALKLDDYLETYRLVTVYLAALDAKLE